MKFLNKIDALRLSYDHNLCSTKDNALLFGVCEPSPPLATHILFKPMSDEIIQNLINEYKRNFPAELLALYKTFNGADLFWTVRYLGKKNIRIPFCRFSIYGIPLTFDRNHIEPFDIRIEDLSRPDDTPDSWLKFGSYYTLGNVERFDLFVDTDNLKVFALENSSDQLAVAATWDSVDECLCYIFDYWQQNKD